MIDYMKRHERYVKDVLEKNPDKEKLKELLAYHDKQIQWMQHERLVHLIVMLFVCLFTLLSFAFTVIRTSTPHAKAGGLSTGYGMLPRQPRLYCKISLCLLLSASDFLQVSV